MYVQCSLHYIYLRLAWRWERDFPDFSSVFFVSSEMELQEEVNRGGLYWLREVLELLWCDVREGWNMDREWVRETLALFLNTAIPQSLFLFLVLLLILLVMLMEAMVMMVRCVESLVAY